MGRLKAALFVMLLAVASATGCGYEQLSHFTRPRTSTLQLTRFFVAVHANDDWNVGRMIANRLTAQGKRVSEGAIEERPDDAEVVVTYEDRRMWDITMYMLSLKVDFRDAHTNELLATAHSFRTSLYRRTPENVVNEVITAAFTPGTR
jgi:hypothetical protein